jgi:hypothetical protein
MLARPVVPGPREPHPAPPLPDTRPKAPLHAPPPSVGHAPVVAPTNFTIGGQQTDGTLVTISRIKGHLALLNAFSALKQEVLQSSLKGPPVGLLEVYRGPPALLQR